MKFGGTSVEDAPAIRRVIEIIKGQQHKKVLVVVSACAGVTNDLINTANTVLDGQKEKALNTADKLRARHKTIADLLLTKNQREKVIAEIDEMFQEIRNMIRGIHLLGELTPRSLDAFMSYGERLSSLIIHAAMEEQNIKTALLDSRKIMITDSNFGSAMPLFDKVEQQIDNIVKPSFNNHDIVITQGFIGANEEGITTTIGRGGSDYTASIFGSLLNSEAIQIWTDVDGMLSANPKIVTESKLIKIISFDEAAELAYFGAKVLHPNTILPAVSKNIPVRILNSRRPEIEGTLIVQSTDEDYGTVVRSIASKKGIIVINVVSSRMLLAYGFLSKLFSIFAKHQKSIDVVSTSEVSVSLTIDNDRGLNDVEKELKNIGEIQIERNKGIVCVVGKGMKQTPGIAARALTALAKLNINVEMISEGASEINLTLVLDEKDIDESVRILHKEFFGD